VTFAHPWMLLGALAALIPLLIHLFDRRRPRPHPFGAISFVLRSQRRTASRLRLKRLLLYALRTIILVALPVALARPELKRAAQVSSIARGPAATSIVLDASMSMRYQDGGTSLFERGRQQARDALRELLPDEPANVLICGPGATAPAAPSFNRGQLRAIIDSAKPTFGSADMNRCLDLAAQSLEENPIAGKRLVLISDLTANALHLNLPPPTVQGAKGERQRPEVVIQDAAGGKQWLPNRAVVDLKIDPALQLGPRSFHFTFTVRNFSSEPVKDLEASLKIAGQAVAKGFLDIPAHGASQKTLSYRFSSGGVFAGEVAISGDNLAADDQRSFVVAVPKEIRALIVNGEPSAVRYRDEAFFVEAALSAPGSPVRETTKDPEAAFHDAFEQYELILLLNVSAPSAEVSRRLIDFVQRGGGLLISLGDHVEPELYNQRLSELLPLPLRVVKTAADAEEPDADRKAAKLGKISIDHPIFSLFTGQAREGLMSAKFFKYMLLEAGSGGGAGKGTEVLATFEDGAPAVAVARRGQGRVLLYTSTVDRDWTDFPIRTSFLPLMQRFSAFLSGSLEEREEIKALVGDSISLSAPGVQGMLSARAPSGATLPMRAQDDGRFMVGPTEEPGVHEVRDSSGRPVPELSFAAVLDASESDLSRIKPEELSAYFGQGVVKDSGPDGKQRHLPFWSWLIVAAALAFFCEGVLLRK
jgi:hypothetical protein